MCAHAYVHVSMTNDRGIIYSPHPLLMTLFRMCSFLYNDDIYLIVIFNKTLILPISFIVYLKNFKVDWSLRKNDFIKIRIRVYSFVNCV